MNDTQREAINDCIEACLETIQNYCDVHPELVLENFVNTIINTSRQHFIDLLNEVDDELVHQTVVNFRRLAIGQDLRISRRDERVIDYIELPRAPFNLDHLGPLNSAELRGYLTNFIDNNRDLLNVEIPGVPPAADIVVEPRAALAEVVERPGNIQQQGYGAAFYKKLQEYGPSAVGFGVQVGLTMLFSPLCAGLVPKALGNAAGKIIGGAAGGAIGGAGGGATQGGLESKVLGEDWEASKARMISLAKRSALLGAAAGALLGAWDAATTPADSAGTGPTNPTSTRPTNPTGTGPTPTGTGPTPTGTGPTPTSTGPTPTSTGPTPTGTGPTPTSTGPTPTSTGPTPTGTGPTNPISTGPTPTGTGPTPTGTGPTPTGTGPTPTGTGPTALTIPVPSGPGPSQILSNLTLDEITAFNVRVGLRVPSSEPISRLLMASRNYYSPSDVMEGANLIGEDIYQMILGQLPASAAMVPAMAHLPPVATRLAPVAIATAAMSLTGPSSSPATQAETRPASRLRQRLNEYAQHQKTKEEAKLRWKADLKARLHGYGRSALVIGALPIAETGGTTLAATP